MCELARALVNLGQSMKIATFSTRDLQEPCRKSYVAGYQVNEEFWWVSLILVISRMFSRKCFLTNFVNEDDLQKFSSVNNSQHTAPCPTRWTVRHKEYIVFLLITKWYKYFGLEIMKDAEMKN